MGLDRWDPCTRLAPGEVVVKVQPPGTPPNGTLGHCFVADLDGNFIGLILERSLRPLVQSQTS